MKILMAQINTTPNSFAGNTHQILEGVARAKSQGADLVVFPELSIPGYRVLDLIYRKGFVDENLRYLKRIAEHATDGITVVVGYVDRNTSGRGRPFRNRLAVLRDGVVIATYTKQLLPYYDVFNENRYFEPGDELTIVDIAGARVGFAICEDLWNDRNALPYGPVAYADNPMARYADAGIDVLVTLNSSPFSRGKPEVRRRMLQALATQHRMDVVYVNQRGGVDDLVFDGRSLYVTRTGGIHAIRSDAGSFEATYCLVDSESIDATSNAERETPENQLLDVLQLGLRDYVHKNGFRDVVVGSSGGIDSALTLALATQALGGERVHAVIMPSAYSSEGSVTDAQALHRRLGCREYTLPIEHFDAMARMGQAFGLQPGSYDPVADENLQARMRGQGIMYFSNAFGALPLTTGNKTELALGYTTLYGDMAGGFSVLSDLLKGEVQQLARVVGVVPQAILTKAPSAELAEGQTDEASLLPYPLLDAVVQAFVEDAIGDFAAFRESRKDNQTIARWIETDPEAAQQYRRMVRLIDLNEYKRRQAAPGIKVSAVAFGTGRQVPITKGEGS